MASVVLMLRIPRRIAVAFAIVMTATACGSFSLPGEGVPLPTMSLRPLPSGVIRGCSGVALPATLTGRADASPVAWLVSATDGSRIEAFWPSGYRAVFAPDLRILADDGTEALREGDYVAGGCLAAGPNSLLLLPPFLAFQVDCGPMIRAQCLSGRVYAIADEQGWPARKLRRLTFLSHDGEYEVEFEDGSRARGVSTAS